tara:strand:+ start:560 stop:925 length:366 start_codon:yes stop_codon:yes gene_type:complete
MIANKYSNAPPAEVPVAEPIGTAAEITAAEIIAKALQDGEFAVSCSPSVLVVSAVPCPSGPATRALQKKFGVHFKRLGFEKPSHPRGYRDEQDVDRWAFTYGAYPFPLNIDPKTFLPNRAS